MSGKTTAGRVIETYGGMRRFEGIETKEAQNMDTREKILAYGLTFQDTYLDRPFHDENWVLVRCRKNKKAFVWTYEYEGQLRINVKVDPQWRDFWRTSAAAAIWEKSEIRTEAPATSKCQRTPCKKLPFTGKKLLR